MSDPFRDYLLRRGLLLGYLVLILAVTLLPSGAEDPIGSVTCLLCGTRGLADAVLNTALFLPLGVALAVVMRRRGAAIVIAATLSTAIELAQTLIPGRHPTLGDVVFNTSGALLGVLAVRWWSKWVLPAPTLSGRMSLTASAGALGVVGLTALLLTPSFPPSLYFGQWTPDLGHLEWYRGKVARFTVGPVDIPPRRLADSDRVRALLVDGAPLVVEAVAGPRIGQLGSLVSIYDDLQREIILLGPDRTDLVYRLRTRAASLRLDQPDLRLYGGMAAAEPGASLEIVVRREGSGHCLEVNANARCGLSFAVGSGWALLYYPEISSAWLAAGLNALWLALLTLPGAFWSTGIRSLTRHSLMLLVGLIAIPMVSDLATISVFELVGVAGGVSLGIGLRWLVRLRARPIAG